MTASSVPAGQAPIATTRFAPSPTGQLHLGHALSAVAAHGLARARGGRFLLRIEDIDRERCRPAFVEGVLDDLRWLGLDWDGEPVIQSQRAAAHAAALDRLRAQGVVYRCTCTRAEIAASASAPQGEAGPVYPGICRAAGHDEARPFAWRLDVARALAMAGPLTWHDGTSEIAADPLAGGDVVVARKGLGVAYHLAVVVDDAEAGVTDVVRGRDLFDATHVQRLLQALLGLPTPAYHHHALVLGPNGRRLAKRTPGATLADLRSGGTDGISLANDLRAGRLPVGFTLAKP